MFSPSQVFFLVLWLLLTSCRSLLLRISPSARPHGINQYSFLVYLLGLHSRVTVTFWTSLLSANLSAYYAFVPSFCSSGYDFAIPSSRLHLAMQTLGVAFGLVGNYLPADFHRRALICPSYRKKGYRCRTAPFCCLIIPLSFALNQHLHINHFYIPQFLSVCVHLPYAISQ